MEKCDCVRMDWNFYDEKEELAIIEIDNEKWEDKARFSKNLIKEHIIDAPPPEQEIARRMAQYGITENDLWKMRNIPLFKDLEDTQFMSIGRFLNAEWDWRKRNEDHDILP
jgi:hypothetical protein